jgi:GNAT superfamily N-acetyltransferase
LERAPLMVYRAAAMPAPRAESPYRIDLVTAAADLRAANRISARAFEISPEALDRVWGPDLLDGLGFRLFLARLDGELVSTVMTTEGGEIVGIWTMATMPERQRQGAGRAVLEHVIAFHLARGTRLFYLLATEAGLPLYARVGFATVAEVPVWLAGGAVA